MWQNNVYKICSLIKSSVNCSVRIPGVRIIISEAPLYFIWWIDKKIFFEIWIHKTETNIGFYYVPLVIWLRFIWEHNACLSKYCPFIFTINAIINNNAEVYGLYWVNFYVFFKWNGKTNFWQRTWYLIESLRFNRLIIRVIILNNEVNFS